MCGSGGLILLLWAAWAHTLLCVRISSLVARVGRVLGSWAFCSWPSLGSHRVVYRLWFVVRATVCCLGASFLLCPNLLADGARRAVVPVLGTLLLAVTRLVGTRIATIVRHWCSFCGGFASHLRLGRGAVRPALVRGVMLPLHCWAGACFRRLAFGCMGRRLRHWLPVVRVLLRSCRGLWPPSVPGTLSRPPS